MPLYGLGKEFLDVRQLRHFRLDGQYIRSERLCRLVQLFLVAGSDRNLCSFFAETRRNCSANAITRSRNNCYAIL